MRIQDNLSLISWTVLDKAIYFIFGFITILIINHTTSYEFGLYSLLVFLNSWIFTVGDSFALNTIIQFGMQEKNNAKVNFFAIINLIVWSLLISILFYLFQDPLSLIFNESGIKRVANLTPLLSLTFIPRTFTLKLMYRERNMKYVFLNNLAFFGTISILVIIMIIQHNSLDFNNLSTFYLTGAFISSVTGLILCRKHLKFSTMGEISIRELFDFSLRITYTNVLHTIPKQIDVFLVKLFFSTENVGLYSAAKNLFRLFDEAINAIYGLLYPTAVKYVQLNDKLSLQKLINKISSFIFWIFTFISVFVLSPIGRIVLELIFPISYIQSLHYFKLMVLVTPLLSFISFYSAITAENKLKLLFKGVLFANIGFFISTFVVGLGNYEQLLPLGLILFFIIFSLIGLFYGIKNYDYNLKYIFIAFQDTINFIKSKKNS